MWGICANNSYPAGFLLESLKIQIDMIETAWRRVVSRLLFLNVGISVNLSIRELVRL